MPRLPRVHVFDDLAHVLPCAVTGGVKPVIQFGKLCPATFSLDFRFPLCPVQAFGLFLSANGWTIAKS